MQLHLFIPLHWRTCLVETPALSADDAAHAYVSRLFLSGGGSSVLQGADKTEVVGDAVHPCAFLYKSLVGIPSHFFLERRMI